ncbi:hypothetical protein ACFS5L_37920 [Streptomyces phyllanthi]|uniref:Uncharacterized protein n=1 Tax=Streptomyces phyllanthi TaxID=1803180 RepID=A0A5N8VYC1_9ACTN|nr:hypothetical protein [Streptomyces phyllanthi]MPY40247.1 hypothetical protein [Streptomyces phyllanthi]
MGAFSWWRSRRENARIERLLVEVNAGRCLAADATAHEASGTRRGIPGVVECWDDIFQFKADSELTAPTEGWRVPKSQIAGVRDGDGPGELVITFRPPARFDAVVVTPLMHADKWRALAMG